MGLVFEAERYEDSVKVPRARGVNAILEERIGFHVDADFTVAYKPYVVLVTSPQDANGDVKFKFVHSETGQLVSDVERTINVRNLTVAYPTSPSTLPTRDEFDRGLRVSFFMLRREGLSTLSDAGIAQDADRCAVSGTHKYPRTAEHARHRAMILAYKNMLNTIRSLAGVDALLTAAQKLDVQRLLEQDV